MPARSDCRFEALRTQGYLGATPEMLLAYYQANGATSGQLQDAEREFLIARGATPGPLNDMWFEFLRGLGLAGAMPDMLYEYWCTLGGVYGP